MIKKLIKYFSSPNSIEVAVSDLGHSKIAYLQSKSSAEYHVKMAEYYQVKIDRLTKLIEGQK